VVVSLGLIPAIRWQNQRVELFFGDDVWYNVDE